MSYGSPTTSIIHHDESLTMRRERGFSNLRPKVEFSIYSICCDICGSRDGLWCRARNETWQKNGDDKQFRETNWVRSCSDENRRRDVIFRFNASAGNDKLQHVMCGKKLKWFALNVLNIASQFVIYWNAGKVFSFQHSMTICVPSTIKQAKFSRRNCALRNFQREN